MVAGCGWAKPNHLQTGVGPWAAGGRLRAQPRVGSGLVFVAVFFTQTTCKLVVSPWGQHWVAGGLLCPPFASFVSVFALFVMVQAFGLNWLKYRLNHLSAQTHFGSSPPIYHRALLGALVVGVGEVGDARVGASSWPSLGNRADG